MGRLEETSDQLRFLLTAGRVRHALELLNLLSSCRFTALYRFDQANLQNLVLIDRESVDAPLMEAIPISDSYCAFVQASGASFVVENSLDDTRVTGHPKRPVVRSYVGVPLKNAQGILFGTLCHFDFDLATVPDDALVLTEQVAGFLDPDVASDALAETFDRNLGALEVMLGLIVDASADKASAVDAFEAYARPIRESARDKLPVARYEAVESKLAQLEAKVISRF